MNSTTVNFHGTWKRHARFQLDSRLQAWSTRRTLYEPVSLAGVIGGDVIGGDGGTFSSGDGTGSRLGGDVSVPLVVLHADSECATLS